MKFNAVDRRNEGKTLIEQCRLAELYLLDVFVEICEQYHLKYYCTAGTILGMMRHDGHFIPWDDDIDVNMPLDDYKKFIRIAPKVLPGNLLLDHRSTVPGTLIHYAKIRDRSSFFCDKNTRVTLPCGIFLDVFPFEKMALPPEWLDRPLHRLCGLSSWSSAANRHAVYSNAFGMIFGAGKVLVWDILHFLTRSAYSVLRLFFRVGWRNPPENSPTYIREFPEECLFPTQKKLFEGKFYEFPHDCDKWLTLFYGDWKVPPPEDKREWHHSIVCPTTPPRAWWAMPYSGGES